MSALLTLVVAAGFAGAAEAPKNHSPLRNSYILKVQADGGSLPGVPGGKAGASGAAGGAGGAGGGGAPGGAGGSPITEDIIMREFGMNEALIRGRLGDLDEEIADLRRERALLRRQLRRATGAADCDPLSGGGRGGDGGSLPGAPGGKGGASGGRPFCDDDLDFSSAKTRAGRKLDGSDGASVAGGVGGLGGKAGSGPGGGSGGSGGVGVGGGRGGKGGAGGSSD